MGPVGSGSSTLSQGSGLPRLMGGHRQAAGPLRLPARVPGSPNQHPQRWLPPRHCQPGYPALPASIHSGGSRPDTAGPQGGLALRPRHRAALRSPSLGTHGGSHSGLPCPPPHQGSRGRTLTQAHGGPSLALRKPGLWLARQSQEQPSGWAHPRGNSPPVTHTHTHTHAGTRGPLAGSQDTSSQQEALHTRGPPDGTGAGKRESRGPGTGGWGWKLMAAWWL